MANMTNKATVTQREWSSGCITLIQSNGYSSRISLLLIILLMAGVILVVSPTTVPTLEVLPLPFVSFHCPLMLRLTMASYEEQLASVKQREWSNGGVILVVASITVPTLEGLPLPFVSLHCPLMLRL
ncbi:hypothetical protein Tco_0868372 [Tanacetum coccineum]